MTFNSFIESRETITPEESAERGMDPLCFSEANVHAFHVYDGEFFIEESGCGEFAVAIENHVHRSFSLRALEIRLWRWADDSVCSNPTRTELLEDDLRLACINWLANNDRNGCYRDSDSIAEMDCLIELPEALELIANQLKG